MHVTRAIVANAIDSEVIAARLGLESCCVKEASLEQANGASLRVRVAAVAIADTAPSRVVVKGQLTVGCTHVDTEGRLVAPLVGRGVV